METGLFIWPGKLFGNRTAVEVMRDKTVLEQAAPTCAVFTDIALSGAKYPAGDWCEYAVRTGAPLSDFHS
jgi:hypothetical protein